MLVQGPLDAVIIPWQSYASHTYSKEVDDIIFDSKVICTKVSLCIWIVDEPLCEGLLHLAFRHREDHARLTHDPFFESQHEAADLACLALSRVCLVKKSVVVGVLECLKFLTELYYLKLRGR